MNHPGDLVGLVLEATRRAFGNIDCVISYTDELPENALGVTVFPDDGSRPQIFLSLKLPLEGLPEVLSHELAHVIVGHKNRHGKEWKKAFSAIHAEHDALFQKASGKPVEVATGGRMAIYDELCRVLTDYEGNGSEDGASADDLYAMLVKIQNGWGVITAQDN
jgi:hypothetical protein